MKYDKKTTSFFRQPLFWSGLAFPALLLTYGNFLPSRGGDRPDPTMGPPHPPHVEPVGTVTAPGAVAGRQKDLLRARQALEAQEEKLEEIAREMSAVLRSRDADDRAALEENLRGMARQLRGHRDLCLPFAGLRERLERARAEAAAYEKLLEIVGQEEHDRLPENNHRDPIVEHLARYEALLKGRTPGDKFGNLVRSQARRFVSDYLPESVREEDQLLFFPVGRVFGPAADRVDRDRVDVVLKTGAVVPLRKLSGQEWGASPGEAVRHYLLRPRGDEGYKISPTGYNLAARHYNVCRPTLGVDRQSLEGFLSASPVHWDRDSEAPLIFQRVSHLLTAVKEHPHLFPAGAPSRPARTTP
jgi:hypothetical protein